MEGEGAGRLFAVCAPSQHDLWSSLAVICGIFSLAPTSLVCFILIFTFPQLAAGREGSYGAAGLEAAQRWGCQKCWVPLAATRRGPTASLGHSSTHSITLGTNQP